MSARSRYSTGYATLVVFAAELLAALLMLAIWWLLLRDIRAFRFERPEMLQALLIGPVLAILFLLHMAWRNRALRRFSSMEILGHAVPGISTTRMLLRFLAFRHGFAFILIALANPQFGTRLEEVRAEGVDLMVAVDVSNSMLAEDLRPSRMEVARRSLSRLIDKLRGDRLGLIVFAGEAYMQLPITTDRSAARLFLAGINTGSVPKQGTAIGSAIELAMRGFDMATPGSRAIIVITDGENHEDDAEGAAREAARAGIVVHTIGMGTPQGAPIPIRRNGQVTGFRKDNAGNTVVSRLDEDMLMRIASAGNGTYIRATERDTGMEELLEELHAMETTETGTWQFTAHESQFQYPLGIGLLLILLSLSVNENRVVRKTVNWTS